MQELKAFPARRLVLLLAIESTPGQRHCSLRLIFRTAVQVSVPDAANLYALLTGRLSSLTYRATLDDESKQFDFSPFEEQNYQNELGFLSRIPGVRVRT